MVQNFQFAQILHAKRQELELTQEDIAKFVGVTRAAVSKWEKGLSYPDITLLPKLATYFNLSIDTLLGYEPQMTKENIDKLYAQYAERFGQEPFEQVENDLQKIMKEYFSCYALLMRIVQLYLNYYMKAEQPQAALLEALTIVEHIKRTAPEISMRNEVQVLEAYIYLLQGNAEAVLELLGTEPKIEQSHDQLIATAHTMQGNVEMAKEVLQVSTFQNILAVVSSSTETLLLETSNESYFDETVRRVESVINLYELNDIQVNIGLVFYVKASMGYMIMQRPEKALQMIERYVDICKKMKFPLAINTSDYFYKVANWIVRQPQISAQAPRDEQSIKADLVNTFYTNPVYVPLHELKAFQYLMTALKHTLKMEEEL